MAEEKVEIPKGITPIWLSGTTISMFNLQEMNEENPIKRVSCKDILADIQFRGKTSDWEPAKATFVDYVDGDKPKEELEVLLVVDEDNVYGDNFYLCKNEETAAEIIEKFTKKDETATEGEAAAEAQEEEEPRPREIVDPDPINRPWQEWEPSEGVTGVKTAESIDALVIRDCDPPLLKYSMSRQRRYFGLGGRFHDVDHVESEDFKPYRDPQFKENTADKELAGPGISIFGTRFMERESASQCVPSTEEAATQTARYRMVNSMVQYAPIMQETSEDDKEQLEEAVGDMLLRTLPLAEDALATNQTIKVFEDDLLRLGDEETLGNTSDNAIKEYTSPFTDINYSKNKIISAIDWMPDAKGVVAVACTEMASLDEQVEKDGQVRNSHILIWNFKDPIHPQFVLEAPGDIFTFRFNPKDSDLLAAGCASGQVMWWKLGAAKDQAAKREKGASSGAGDDERVSPKDEVKAIKPYLASTIEGSHKRPVSALSWLPAENEIQPRTGRIVAPTTHDGISQQLVTLAPDGMVLFWDLRQKKEDKNGALLWQYIYKINVSSVEGLGELSGCRLCLSPATEGEEVTHFHLGTEDGELVNGSWLLPEAEENPSHVISSHAAHYGPVVSVQRSPFFQDTILTVGDWTFNIYKAAAKEPVIKSSFAPTGLTCGRFSPTRPGVIVTARADGSVDIWDLLDRSHEASLQHNVGPAAVTALEFWGDGSPNLQLLAVGDQQGTLHVFEIPRNLRRPLPNEGALVDALLKRELARVGYMTSRAQFRRQELSVKEAEDEEKKRAEEEQRAKAAAEEARARELAEAEAQAIAAGEAEAVLAEQAKEDEVTSKLEPADEAAEAQYRLLEAAFREKVGLTVPEA